MASYTTHPSAHSYAASGFSNKMGWGVRPALVMVDVCTAYWSPDSPLDTSSNPDSVSSPPVMRNLVAAARKGGCPIVWTQVSYDDPQMKDAGLFYLKSKALTVWQRGDQRGWGKWVEGLEPMLDGSGRGVEWVVKKKYPSGFFGTTLATDLYTRGVDTVVICGVSTSGCVRATALDAMCYGFRPMIVPEACGDRSREIHNANIFDLNAKYADAVSEAEAVEKLQAGWYQS